MNALESFHRIEEDYDDSEEGYVRFRSLGTLVGLAPMLLVPYLDWVSEYGKSDWILANAQVPSPEDVAELAAYLADPGDW